MQLQFSNVLNNAVCAAGQLPEKKHMRDWGWRWRAALFQLLSASCGKQADSLAQEAAHASPHQCTVGQPLPAGFLLLASAKAVTDQVNQCGISLKQSIVQPYKGINTDMCYYMSES